MSDIADLELLKKLAGIEDTTRDDVLQFLIDGAWDTACKYTGLLLNDEQTQSEYIIDYSKDYHRPSFSPAYLSFDNRSFYYYTNIWRPPQGIYPLVNCTSLTIDGSLIKADDYYVSDGCLYLREGSFSPVYGKNIADITFGLSAEKVPDDLRNAVIQLALIRNARLGHLDLKSKTGISKETDAYWDTEMTPAIKEVFELYRVRFYD